MYSSLHDWLSTLTSFALACSCSVHCAATSLLGAFLDMNTHLAPSRLQKQAEVAVSQKLHTQGTRHHMYSLAVLLTTDGP
jgi:hypothetical protein